MPMKEKKVIHIDHGLCSTLTLLETLVNSATPSRFFSIGDPRTSPSDCDELATTGVLNCNGDGNISAAKWLLEPIRPPK